MKRLFLPFLAIFCLFAVTACEKTDSVEAAAVNELMNTTWEQEESVSVMGYSIDFSFVIYLKDDMTFTFDSEVGGVILAAMGAAESYSVSGTWSFDDPMLYMTAEGETLSAEIKGDKMYVETTEIAEEYDFEVVLTKK